MLAQISKYRHLYFQALPISNHPEDHGSTWRFLEIIRGIHVEHNKRLVLSLPDMYVISLVPWIPVCEHWTTPWRVLLFTHVIQIYFKYILLDDSRRHRNQKSMDATRTELLIICQIPESSDHRIIKTSWNLLDDSGGTCYNTIRFGNHCCRTRWHPEPASSRGSFPSESSLSSNKN